MADLEKMKLELRSQEEQLSASAEQVISQVNESIRQAAQKDKKGKYDLPVKLALGLTKIYATYQTEINQEAGQRSFLKYKNKADLEIAKWSNDDLTERNKKLLNPEKYLKKITDELQNDIKELPKYMQQKVLDQYQGFVGQNILKQHKNLIRSLEVDKKKRRNELLKSITENWSNTSLDDKEAQEEAKNRAEATSELEITLSQSEKDAIKASGKFTGQNNRAILESNHAYFKTWKENKKLFDSLGADQKRMINDGLAKTREASKIKFVKSIEGLKSLEDLKNTIQAAQNTGDSEYIKWTDLLLNIFDKSFGPGRGGITSEELNQIGQLSKKLNLDEEQIDKIKERISFFMQNRRNELGLAFKGINAKYMSLETRTALGFSPVSTTEAFQIGEELMGNPDQAESIISTHAANAGLGDNEMVLTSFVLNQMSAQEKISKSDRLKISALKFKLLNEGELGMSMSQFFNITDQMRNIPLPSQFNISDDVQRAYGQHFNDVLEAQKVIAYYKTSLQEGGGKISFQNEKFKDIFVKHVEAAFKGESSIRKAIDFVAGTSKPYFIPIAQWRALPSDQQRELNRVLNAIASPTKEQYKNYSPIIQERIRAGHNFTWNLEGNRLVLFSTIGANTIRARDYQGNVITSTVPELTSGYDLGLGTKRRYGQKWGYGEETARNIFNEYNKTIPFRSKKQQKVLKDFRVGDLEKFVASNYAKKIISIKTASGELDKEPFPFYLNRKVLQAGLPRQANSLVGLLAVSEKLEPKDITNRIQTLKNDMKKNYKAGDSIRDVLFKTLKDPLLLSAFGTISRKELSEKFKITDKNANKLATHTKKVAGYAQGLSANGVQFDKTEDWLDTSAKELFEK